MCDIHTHWWIWLASTLVYYVFILGIFLCVLYSIDHSQIRNVWQGMAGQDNMPQTHVTISCHVSSRKTHVKNLTIFISKSFNVRRCLLPPLKVNHHCMIARTFYAFFLCILFIHSFYAFSPCTVFVHWSSYNCCQSLLMNWLSCISWYWWR